MTQMSASTSGTSTGQLQSWRCCFSAGLEDRKSDTRMNLPWSLGSMFEELRSIIMLAELQYSLSGTIVNSNCKDEYLDDPTNHFWVQEAATEDSSLGNGRSQNGSLFYF